MTARRPLLPEVAVNFAQTWDARISTRTKTPATFSSPEDKRRMWAIRASGDALMVGRGTLEADRMEMGLPDERLIEERVKGGKTPLPLRVVISQSGKLDLSAPLFQKEGAPILLFSTEAMPSDLQQRLAEKGVHLYLTKEVDLREVLSLLAERWDVKRVICEGGGMLVRSLAELGLLSEVNLTLCPRLFGGKEAPSILGTEMAFLPYSQEFRLDKMEVVGDECFLRYRWKRRSQTAR